MVQDSKKMNNEQNPALLRSGTGVQDLPSLLVAQATTAVEVSDTTGDEENYDCSPYNPSSGPGLFQPS